MPLPTEQYGIPTRDSANGGLLVSYTRGIWQSIGEAAGLFCRLADCLFESSKGEFVGILGRKAKACCKTNMSFCFFAIAFGGRLFLLTYVSRLGKLCMWFGGFLIPVQNLYK